MKTTLQQFPVATLVYKWLTGRKNLYGLQLVKKDIRTFAEKCHLGSACAVCAGDQRQHFTTPLDFVLK